MLQYVNTCNSHNNFCESLFFLPSHFSEGNIKAYLGVFQPVNARQVHLGFGQMEENAWSHGNARRAFILGWDEHAHHKPCVAQQEVPGPLYTKCTQSWQGAKTVYNTV